jgi:hypothetical protein
LLFLTGSHVLHFGWWQGSAPQAAYYSLPSWLLWIRRLCGSTRLGDTRPEVHAVNFREVLKCVAANVFGLSVSLDHPQGAECGLHQWYTVALIQALHRGKVQRRHFARLRQQRRGQAVRGPHGVPVVPGPSVLAGKPVPATPQDPTNNSYSASSLRPASPVSLSGPARARVAPTQPQRRSGSLNM